jgi:DNA replication protein DnaC
VLILDDLGVDAPNDWWVSKLYNLVNRRWLSDLPTIVTTNLEPKALREAIGERTLSRLGERAVTIRLTGGDRRRPPR